MRSTWRQFLECDSEFEENLELLQPVDMPLATTDSDFCLVTNDNGPPETICQCCIFDASIENFESTKLRKQWGMPEDSDSVPSPLYTISLRLDWHAMFEANRWTFVPEKTMLKSIVTALLQSKLKKVNTRWNKICPPSPKYSYKLVSFGLGKTPITRQSTPGSLRETTYHSPYGEFPSLNCSAHPYFVIQKAWDLFNTHIGSINGNRVETYTLLRTIVALWEELSAFPFEASPPIASSSATVVPQEDSVGSSAKPNPSKRKRVSAAAETV